MRISAVFSPGFWRGLVFIGSVAVNIGASGNGIDHPIREHDVVAPGLLAYEGFDYQPSDISNSAHNGGSGWDGPWTNVLGRGQVDLDSLLGGPRAPKGFDRHSAGNFFSGGSGVRIGRRLDRSARGEFARRGYLNPDGNVGADGRTLYVSFLLQAGDSPKFYEFEFHRDDLGDAGRIAGVGNDTSGRNVNFRAPRDTHLMIGPGDTRVNFYVVRIDFKPGNDDVRIYRNPTSDREPPEATVTAWRVADMSFNGISIGAHQNYVAADEIRVGATWEDVIGRTARSAVAGNCDDDGVRAAKGQMILPGIAEFIPEGFEPRKMPSVALVKERSPIGKLESGWALRPEFLVVQGRALATLDVPEGTSLYGGGEVTGPLLRNGQTIVLWNTDTGGYGVDGGRRLYQAHPWVMGVRPDGTAFGVLFDSTSKATLTTGSERIEFLSHGPLFRAFVIDRESPQAVLRGLAELTGTLSMPPRWALGYHQCRFSYTPESRVREVADTFRAKRIPCDAIWMDIDYMDGFRVFTFHPTAFQDPRRLNDYLHDRGFHSVWMIDPGVKVDPGYGVYDSGSANDVWVKTACGADFHGKVWPGACVFPDFTRPETRAWWSGLYEDFLAKGVDGVWNDMNEPAVADGPLGTMPYDNWHRGGGDLPSGPHLLYHNIYGRLMVQATYEGMLAVRPERRPFVLSRANFIGGQRYAATWTGDNAAEKRYMTMSIPMSLTLGLSGQPFSGPDLGGFLQDTTPELWGKWIGFGAFFPFARGHACAGTNQKEPWSFGKTMEDATRIALERRYRLLPYLYTLFHESVNSGLPVMQPVFFADPKDQRLRAEEEAFLIGSDLLVIPSWSKHPALPRGTWMPITLVDGDSGPYQAELRIRGGAIVPVGAVVQSTMEDSFKPLTLIVCLDENGSASGTLYRDAGDGWGFRKGEFSLQHFKATQTGDRVTVQLDRTEGKWSLPDAPLVVEVAAPDGVHKGRGTIRSGVVIEL